VNLRRCAAIALALLLLPLLSSCVSVLSPTGWAPVAFDGDTAYVTTSKGRISALTLDGDTAEAKWTFPDPDIDADDRFKTRAIYGAPVIDGDRVYVATFEGGIFALRAADGRPEWPGPEGNRNQYDGDIAGGLALAGDTLFFGTTEGRLYGWNKADGSRAPGWAEPKSFDGGIWATPVVAGDTLIIATMKGDVYGLSIADGSEKWHFETTGAVADLALIGEDLLFVPGVNRHAYFLRAADGAEVTEFRAEDWLWTYPAFSAGKVFFGDFGGHVHGLDISSGSANELWPPPSVDGERIRSGPAIIDDVLVVADRKPVITFINATTGEVLNTVPIPDAGTVRANLVVREGSAYFTTTDGKLFRADPQARRVLEVLLSGVKR
jgi:outer membrane protein assembly factor BamB